MLLRRSTDIYPKDLTRDMRDRKIAVIDAFGGSFNSLLGKK